MEYQFVKRELQTTKEWSGGTTTELAIFPSSADYAKKDFLWRISSANVEIEESTFTSLPGIDRILMVLEGRLKLSHKGHYDKTLNEFEQDNFSGDWETNSFGIVTDFNLMLNKGCKGTVEVKRIGLGEELIIGLNEEDANTKAIYIYDGYVEINTDIKELESLSGDLFIVEQKQNCTNNIVIGNPCEDEATLIICDIKI